MRLWWLSLVLVWCTSCASNVFVLVEEGRTAELDRLLYERPGEAQRRDDQRRTPLHVAATYRQAACVSVLLGAGADPNAEDRFGLTPTQLAISEGDAKTTALLLAAGVPVNAPLKDQLTLMDYAQARTNNDDVIQVLRERGGKSKAEIDAALLERKSDAAPAAP